MTTFLRGTAENGRRVGRRRIAHAVAEPGGLGVPALCGTKVWTWGAIFEPRSHTSCHNCQRVLEAGRRAVERGVT